MKQILALDVGGTFIKYALMSEEGEIVQQGKTPTPLTSQLDFFECIDQIVKQYSEEIEGMSLSLPGTIDATRGYVFQGGTLRYNSMCELKKLMEEHFHLPIEIENDAHCAALAELWKGNLQGIKNAMVLTFGTGIGGCVIIDGKPYKGTHLFAGEVSILLTKDIREDGMQAIWGPQGSPTKFAKRVANEKQLDSLDGTTLFQFIDAGDEVSCRMFEDYCHDIVRQLLNFQILLDPQRICLGGGISVNPSFIDGIVRTLNVIYDQIPLAIPRLEIMPCKFHNDSNLLGAFYNFNQRHRQ